eukprot:UN04591
MQKVEGIIFSFICFIIYFISISYFLCSTISIALFLISFSNT